MTRRRDVFRAVAAGAVGLAAALLAAAGGLLTAAADRLDGLAGTIWGR